MIALAAHPLGVRSTVLEPSAESCAAHVADHIRGEFDDFQALYKLAQAVVKGEHAWLETGIVDDVDVAARTEPIAGRVVASREVAAVS